MMQRLFVSLMAVMVVAVAGVRVSAQAPTDRIDRTLEEIRRNTRAAIDRNIPAEQRARVDYGAYLTLSYLSADDASLTNHGLRQMDLLPYVLVNLDDIHEFYARGRIVYRDFNPGDSFDGDGDGFDGNIEEAYYRFDLARSLAASSGKESGNEARFTFGRQYLQWMSGLVFSNYIDGALGEIDIGQVKLTLLAGITPRDTIDFDSSRPHFDDRTYRGFFGGMASVKLASHRPFIYYMVQRDFNDHDETLTLGQVQTKFEYNSQYLGAGSTGSFGDRMLYGLELIYESGKGLSNSYDENTFEPIDQSHEPIEAFAADLRLDYVWPTIHRPRLGGELILASGDEDRLDSTRTFNGNVPNSSDHSFNAFGYVNNGLAFAPAVSNLVIGRVGGSIYPMPTTKYFRKMQLAADLLAYFKLREDGGIIEPSTDESFLGIEPDLSVNWEVFDDLFLAVRYGVFFPGDGVFADDEVRQFLYIGVTYAF